MSTSRYFLARLAVPTYWRPRGTSTARCRLYGSSLSLSSSLPTTTAYKDHIKFVLNNFREIKVSFSETYSSAAENAANDLLVIPLGQQDVNTKKQVTDLICSAVSGPTKHPFTLNVISGINSLISERKFEGKENEICMTHIIGT
jgi:hypothetical protein